MLSDSLFCRLHADANSNHVSLRIAVLAHARFYPCTSTHCLPDMGDVHAPLRRGCDAWCTTRYRPALTCTSTAAAAQRAQRRTGSPSHW